MKPAEKQEVQWSALKEMAIVFSQLLGILWIFASSGLLLATLLRAIFR